MQVTMARAPFPVKYGRSFVLAAPPGESAAGQV